MYLYKKAVEILQNGGLVIYPTETFYAIGCIANDISALKTIYEIKKRNKNKSLPILAGSIEQVDRVADLNQAPTLLIQKFWPGPLTLLLTAKNSITKRVQNNKGKIAIRVSSHPVAKAIAELVGFPLVCTSANISGMPPASCSSAISLELIEGLQQSGREFVIIEDTMNEKKYTSPSTIVEPIPLDSNRWRLQVTRWGAIDRQALNIENFVIIDYNKQWDN